MFLSIGALMLGYGALTWKSPIYAQSLGQNINVLWGGVMLLFGGLMYFLGRRAKWQNDPTHPRSWERKQADAARVRH
jgi:hypothetical protein